MYASMYLSNQTVKIDLETAGIGEKPRKRESKRRTVILNLKQTGRELKQQPQRTSKIDAEKRNSKVETNSEKRKKKDTLVDIRLRGEINWITSNIYGVGGLVHPYPVNPHRSRECKMLQVNFAEAI